MANENSSATNSVEFDLKDNKISVAGPLNFDTVPQLKLKANQFLKQLSGDVTFDLAKVTRCDSAALALLTVWTYAARRQNKKIVFVDLPKQLLDIAKLSGLDRILPIN